MVKCPYCGKEMEAPMRRRTETRPDNTLHIKSTSCSVNGSFHVENHWIHSGYIVSEAI